MSRPIVLALLVMAACRPPVQDPDEPSQVPSSDELEVKSSAEQDLDCFRDEIEVAATDDPEIYVAAGCGRSARYTISCTDSGSAMSASSSTTCTASRVEEESEVEGEE